MPGEDAGGRLLIPGLIDCHTHLAFGGWRAEEFERRLRGESYLDIARAGGGIASTVRATRAATADALAARARATLDAMARLGVTTVECKSGYGLDRDNELKLLEVYRDLASSPPSLRSRSVSSPPSSARTSCPPNIAIGVRRTSICCATTSSRKSRGATSRRSATCSSRTRRSRVEEARAILRAGQAHGLRAKLHADQLHDGGGAALAAEVGAVSADHLEHVSDDGIARMREAGVVAVSLPIATLYLNAPPMPARRVIEAGVPVAVATDFNPGSAPSYHLPLALTLACTMQRMTPAEALKGATIYAARAIGLEQEIGSLEPGKSADFALIDAPDVTTWLYHFQANACAGTWVRGQRVA